MNPQVTNRGTPAIRPLTWRACCGGVLLAFGLCLGCPAVEAEPAASPTDAQTRDEELKAQEDPTILLRRAWLETEWNKFEDGGLDIEQTLAGLWSWRISSRQEWGVRLKVPYRWHLAGDAPGDQSRQGWADLKLATGTAFLLRPNWRLGGGLEVRMPTAQKDMDLESWGFQEFLATGWDATRWLTFSPSVEYNQSVGGPTGEPSQHYLEAYFPASFIVGRGWALVPRYEFKTDFEQGNQTTHSGKLQIVKQFENPPLALSASIKRTFDGGAKDFTVNFAATWFFR